MTSEVERYVIFYMEMEHFKLDYFIQFFVISIYTYACLVVEQIQLKL